MKWLRESRRKRHSFLPRTINMDGNYSIHGSRTRSSKTSRVHNAATCQVAAFQGSSVDLNTSFIGPSRPRSLDVIHSNTAVPMMQAITSVLMRSVVVLDLLCSNPRLMQRWQKGVQLTARRRVLEALALTFPRTPRCLGAGLLEHGGEKGLKRGVALWVPCRVLGVQRRGGVREWVVPIFVCKATSGKVWKCFENLPPPSRRPSLSGPGAPLGVGRVPFSTSERVHVRTWQPGRGKVREARFEVWPVWEEPQCGPGTPGASQACRPHLSALE